MIYLRTSHELHLVQSLRVMSRPGRRGNPDQAELSLVAYTWDRYGKQLKEYTITESNNEDALRVQLNDLSDRLSSGEALVIVTKELADQRRDLQTQGGPR